MKFQSILRNAIVGCALMGAVTASQAQDAQPAPAAEAPVAPPVEAPAAPAKEISPSHLEAARQVIAAIQSTAIYDNVLPQAAFALKSELIQQNPDKQEEISALVEQKALELASRRADLETEAARAYANNMSEDDLKAIAAFYVSPAGKKLLETGPIAQREVTRAAGIWQQGIARDLAQAVGQELATRESTTPADQPAAQDGAEQPKPAN